jgi:hypothetical protein
MPLRAFAIRMSRLLLWTLASFCLAAILSVVVVLSLGCITQSGGELCGPWKWNA